MGKKVAIVTGGSDGIGREVAARLADMGITVIIASRAEGIDVTKDEDRKKLVQEAISTFGRIDILVNNAGMGIYGVVADIDPDDYRKVYELNVVAPLALMQLVIPYMRAQGGGTIVNVSSRSAKHHFVDIGGYASTKHALNALSLTAREELAADNISVGVVMPGIVDTAFGKHAVRTDEKVLEIQRKRRERIGHVDTVQFAAQKVLEAIETRAAETMAVGT